MSTIQASAQRWLSQFPDLKHAPPMSEITVPPLSLSVPRLIGSQYTVNGINELLQKNEAVGNGDLEISDLGDGAERCVIAKRDLVSKRGAKRLCLYSRDISEVKPSGELSRLMSLEKNRE